jgi:hypothetical protein
MFYVYMGFFLKINCPKCDNKIGSYNWYGHKCSCLTWVVPAFHIYESKVDLCNPLPILPNVLNRQIFINTSKFVIQDDDEEPQQQQQKKEEENIENKV